ncbi:MAG TPA: lysophospholipid acyltransferase family protein, partial [Candidatus Limnocylindria bacterium]|nr:lysophospholipid acyltransferase family protein [Candidatus Limnocylindria bacterium]
LIEEELGVYLDEDALDPDATLGELQAMIDAAAGERREQGILAWPLNPAVGALRIAAWQAVVRPVAGVFYRLRVSGLEHLRGLDGPVLFAANHHLHNDNVLILSAIPLRWRRKLTVAAAADDIFGSRWRGFVAALLGNAFPMAREGAVRRSFELLGARLDRGFSVLIYPEGKLTVGGPLQPFKSGTGLVAIHGATPVVPIRLKVHRPSRIDADVQAPGRRPWRGEVEVVFGRPMRFGIDTDPNAATAEIERAVAAL